MSFCPLCGKSMFLAFAGDAFLVRCLQCRANITNLAIAQVVKASIGDLQRKHAYEMSTYGSTYDFLQRRCASLRGSEYFPGKLPGEFVNGVRNEDVQNLSFADNSLDLITSNQVFEHVPDTLTALSECKRTLKPGGSLIFTVPLYDERETVQVAKLGGNCIEWLAAPEYHSSRRTGANSVPVFWRFSLRDIVARVMAAGFASARIVPVSLCSVQRSSQPVVHAIA